MHGGRVWVEDDELNPASIVDGDEPLATGEVAVDRGTADDNDLVVGQSVTLLTLGGQEPVTVVGISEFGDHDAEDGGGTVDDAGVPSAYEVTLDITFNVRDIP